MITQELIDKKLYKLLESNNMTMSVFTPVGILLDSDNRFILKYNNGSAWYLQIEKVKYPNIIKNLLFSKNKIKIELALNLL